MLGWCKVGTGGEHTTCHNGNLRSLRNLHGIHHILHGILHSHSRLQVRHRPHACRSSHHGSHRNSCSLRILHGILRSHSRAQPRPHACRSSPCCIQDHNHHILHILHGSLRIRCIRNKAQQQPQVRHRPHACRSSPCCIQDRSSCSLRILHGILHSHSRAQPQPHACRSIPCIHQGCIHRSLHIRNTARLQPLPRLQARQPQWLPGQELR